jgi:hypothetical protein
MTSPPRGVFDANLYEDFLPLLISLAYHDELTSSLIILASYGAFLYLRRLYFLAYPPKLPAANNTPSPAMDLKVDIAIVFRAATTSLLKSAIREDAKQAEQQYTKLVETLKAGGLYATGRRGSTRDQLIVLVYCPEEKLVQLVQKERYVIQFYIPWHHH